MAVEASLQNFELKYSRTSIHICMRTLFVDCVDKLKVRSLSNKYCYYCLDCLRQKTSADKRPIITRYFKYGLLVVEIYCVSGISSYWIDYLDNCMNFSTSRNFQSRFPTIIEVLLCTVSRNK